jgi:hypothetical protein
LKHDEAYYGLIEAYITAAAKIVKRRDLEPDLFNGLVALVTTLLTRQYDYVVLLNACLGLFGALLGRYPEDLLREFGSSVINGIFAPSFSVINPVWIT